jgi:hypothetical protein
LLKFIIALLILAVALIGGVHWLHKMAWIDRIPTFVFQSVIFLAFSTGIIYRYLYNLSKPSEFVQLYLLLMVVKLIAFLGYNIFMVLKAKEEAKYNVLFFLAAYFAFTFMEIVFLHRHINSKTPR